MKELLISDIQKQTLELNELESQIYEKQKVINSQEEMVDAATQELTIQVQKQAEDDLFKKDLSNETKRQYRIKMLMQENHSDIIASLRKHKDEMKDLQHKYTMLSRTHSSTKIIANLVANGN